MATKTRRRDKAEVTGIVIAYPDGTTKKLSLDDAEQLYSQLDKLFGEKERIVPQPYPVWPRPWIIERDRWTRWTTTTNAACAKAVDSSPTLYLCENGTT